MAKPKIVNTEYDNITPVQGQLDMSLNTLNCFKHVQNLLQILEVIEEVSRWDFVSLHKNIYELKFKSHNLLIPSPSRECVCFSIFITLFYQDWIDLFALDRLRPMPQVPPDLLCMTWLQSQRCDTTNLWFFFYWFSDPLKDIVSS